MADSGISKDSTATWPAMFAIIVFISIALYNVIELNFIILATFKKRRGLYFWSFLAATWGIAVYAIGFLMKDIQVGSNVLYVTLIVAGWCSMVTGQSVVLYSRLHIVLRDRKKMRMILAMIVFNALICHTPIIVMVYGANSANPEPFLLPYSIYEKVQVTIFFIQELILSGIYISATVKLMKLEASVRSGTRRIMNHLIYVNIIIVFLDITILALEYAGLYDIQTAYKALVYAVKLKLEFSILNRLIELTQGDNKNNGSFTRSRTDKSGVTLDTFELERQKRLTKDAKNVGYNAYIHTGVQAKPGGVTPDGVMRTTEIMVQSDRRGAARDCESHSERDSERDAESVDDKSGITTDSTISPPERTRGISSSSSSQIQFANVGF